MSHTYYRCLSADLSKNHPASPAARRQAGHSPLYSTVQSSSTTTVPASALLKATDDKIGDTSDLPGDAENVVDAIVSLNSDMFKIIENDLISKDNANSLIKSYIDLLYNVKDKCRNGYFHKHRIDDYDTLCEKREMVLEAIARTIIFLK